MALKVFLQLLTLCLNACVLTIPHAIQIFSVDTNVFEFFDEIFGGEERT